MIGCLNHGWQKCEIYPVDVEMCPTDGSNYQLAKLVVSKCRGGGHGGVHAVCWQQGASLQAWPPAAVTGNQWGGQSGPVAAVDNSGLGMPVCGSVGHWTRGVSTDGVLWLLLTVVQPGARVAKPCCQPGSSAGLQCCWNKSTEPCGGLCTDVQLSSQVVATGCDTVSVQCKADNIDAPSVIGTPRVCHTQSLSHAPSDQRPVSHKWS